MIRGILVGCSVGLAIIFGASFDLAAEDSHVFLQKAMRDKKPTKSLSAVKYLEASLKENGFKCIVAVVPSKQQKRKYWLSVHQLPSRSRPSWEDFTGEAIVRAAILVQKAKWEATELFLSYSPKVTMGEKKVGWAYISIDDCIEARAKLLSSGDRANFTSLWKSRIAFLTAMDPKPIL